MQEKIKKIWDLIKENNICGIREVYSHGIFIHIIVDGDWKHSHICLNHVLSINNYHCVGEIDVEDSDEDFYESTHVFVEV